jgi:hypothetical protein
VLQGELFQPDYYLDIPAQRLINYKRVKAYAQQKLFSAYDFFNGAHSQA